MSTIKDDQYSIRMTNIAISNILVVVFPNLKKLLLLFITSESMEVTMDS